MLPRVAAWAVLSHSLSLFKFSLSAVFLGTRLVSSQRMDAPTPPSEECIESQIEEQLRQLVVYSRVLVGDA